MTPQTIGNIIGKSFLPDSMNLSKTPPERLYKPVAYDLGYNTTGLPKCCTEAHRATQWWLNDIINKQLHRKRWVTLYGKSGCGKTHLAIAAKNCLREFGKKVLYWNWSKLRSASEWSHWNAGDVNILILDDIGSGFTGTDKAREAAASILYSIMEERLNKWTFFTTNLTPDGLPDVRLASRLFRGQNEVVDMREAGDYAYIMKRK